MLPADRRSAMPPESTGDKWSTGGDKLVEISKKKTYCINTWKFHARTCTPAHVCVHVIQMSRPHRQSKVQKTTSQFATVGTLLFARTRTQPPNHKIKHVVRTGFAMGQEKTVHD